MDRKSEILTIVFLIIALASIVATYYRYIVQEDISYETDENAFQAALLEN